MPFQKQRTDYSGKSHRKQEQNHRVRAQPFQRSVENFVFEFASKQLSIPHRHRHDAIQQSEFQRSGADGKEDDVRQFQKRFRQRHLQFQRTQRQFQSTDPRGVRRYSEQSADRRRIYRDAGLRHRSRGRFLHRSDLQTLDFQFGRRNRRIQFQLFPSRSDDATSLFQDQFGLHQQVFHHQRKP